jgi:hypothetical protein
VIPYLAQLRVYEPLTAMPADEQQSWAEYVATGNGVDTVTGVEREHLAGLAALVRIPTGMVPDPGEHAYVRRIDGSTYVCPWRTRLRAWEALAAFRRALPERLADAFVPGPAAAAAEADRERWAADHPSQRSHILTSTWAVPLPWFALFDPHERQLLLGGRSGSPRRTSQTDTVRTLRYVTPMSRARQRLARALHVLERTLADRAAAESVAEVGRWLEEFHPHSLVELDYGGLVHLFDDDQLAGEDSVPVLAGALAALAAGDVDRAGEDYRRLLRRWRRFAALENAN